MFEKRNCAARRIAVGAALTAVPFLSGCGAEGSAQTSTNMVAPDITGPVEYGDWSPAPENTFRVSFLADGREIGSQEIPEGRPLADAPEVSIPGLVFSGWENENGDLTEPVGALIYGDATYTARLYPDLSSHDPYLFPDENGEILLEGLLGRNWAPGFFHIAGYLYYADEAGNLLRDTDDGPFHFLPDGRYTSGDEELDALVAELLAGWIAETPEAEGDALLQKAYLYVRDMTYSGGNHYDFGAVGWDVEEGKRCSPITTTTATAMPARSAHWPGGWAMTPGVSVEKRLPRRQNTPG